MVRNQTKTTKARKPLFGLADLLRPIIGTQPTPAHPTPVRRCK